jgi:archaellin
MLRQQRVRPAQRISLVGMVIVAMIAAAVAVAIETALREGAGELVREHLRPAQTRCGGVRRAYR